MMISSKPSEQSDLHFLSDKYRKMVNFKVGEETRDDVINMSLVCATDKTKLWLSPSAKQRCNPCSGPSHVYQDLSMRHDLLPKLTNEIRVSDEMHYLQITTTMIKSVFFSTILIRM